MDEDQKPGVNPALSQGAVWAMYNGEPDAPEQPTLQILSIKKMTSSNSSAQAERHRLILSDGANFVQGMLATQLNDIIHSNQIDKNSIVRLVKWASNVVQNRRIIICLEVDVLVFNAGEKIGTPVSAESQGGAAPAAAPGQAAPAAAPAARSAPAPAAPANNGANGASTASSRAPPAPTRAGGQGARGGPSRGGAGGTQAPPIFPIEGLSPYQNKWTIKARVLTKSDVRHWHNARGEGKLFSVTLMDDTGEIRATGFGDHVDNFHPLLEEGQVYLISRGKIQIAKKQFSAGVNNEYEIQFDANTEIERCTDTEGLPQVKYSFVALGDLMSIEKDQLCDVIGVVQSADEVQSLTAKSGKPFDKRELHLVDSSGFQTRVTLFGETAKKYNAADSPIIAFKGVKVSDFGGRSLSMVGAASMQIDPQIEEAYALRGWYDEQGSGGNFASHTNASAGTGGPFKASEFRNLVDAGLLGQGEQQDYFNTRATIILIRHENLSYPACQNPTCNKKVFRDDDDRWKCEKCNQWFEAPRYRYVMSMNVADPLGSMWLSAFDDVGQLVLGCTADDIEAVRDANPEGVKKEVNSRAALKTFNFACRAKTETYNDTSRVKFSVTRAQPVNFVEGALAYAEEIRQHGIQI